MLKDRQSGRGSECWVTVPKTEKRKKKMVTVMNKVFTVHHSLILLRLPSVLVRRFRVLPLIPDVLPSPTRNPIPTLIRSRRSHHNELSAQEVLLPSPLLPLPSPPPIPHPLRSALPHRTRTDLLVSPNPNPSPARSSRVSPTHRTRA